jgi:hypothetical protein
MLPFLSCLVDTILFRKTGARSNRYKSWAPWYVETCIRPSFHSPATWFVRVSSQTLIHLPHLLTYRDLLIHFLFPATQRPCPQALQVRRGLPQSWSTHAPIRRRRLPVLQLLPKAGAGPSDVRMLLSSSHKWIVLAQVVAGSVCLSFNLRDDQTLTTAAARKPTMLGQSQFWHADISGMFAHFHSYTA